MPKFNVSAISRKDFRDKALKISVVAKLMASFTPTNKDDLAVELIAHLFEDDEHFGKLCDLIGIPPDGLVPPVT